MPGNHVLRRANAILNHLFRANPTDNPNNLNGFFGSSRSMAKGAYGIGDVVVEPLRDVWKVRKYIDSEVYNMET